MKKQLGLLLAVLMIFSAVAFANGPLLGVSTVPVAGAFGVLSVGYDFGPINLEAWKLNMTTPFGLWALGILWTPELDSFGYRVGVELILDYVAPIPPLPVGVVQYNAFTFIVGVSQTWGPIQLYGELDLMPIGVLAVAPVVGFNILFGDLIPPKSGTVVGTVRQ